MAFNKIGSIFEAGAEDRLDYVGIIMISLFYSISKLLFLFPLIDKWAQLVVTAK